MTFIITLISLIIERYFHWNQLRNWRWFDKYQLWLSTRIGNWPPYLSLLVCILPLLIVVGLIQFLLAGKMYDIFQLIFGVIVLVYCLGPDNLWMDTYRCIAEFNKGDPKAAIECARSAFAIPLPENSQAFHQNLIRAIFVEAHQRIFAVLFWFVLLGPLGAVLYRTVALSAERSDLGVTLAAAEVQRVLDWVPARLFTFIFALGGHFNEVFAVWKKDVKNGLRENEKLLADCGFAAMDLKRMDVLPEDGSAEKEALSLLDRVFVMGLVVLAIIVLVTS